MDADYSDPETVEFALKEWGDVFKKLPARGCDFRARWRSGPHRAEISDGVARKGDCDIASLASARADVDLAAKFRSGVVR